MNSDYTFEIIISILLKDIQIIRAKSVYGIVVTALFAIIMPIFLLPDILLSESKIFFFLTMLTTIFWVNGMVLTMFVFENKDKALETLLATEVSLVMVIFAKAILLILSSIFIILLSVFLGELIYKYALFDNFGVLLLQLFVCCPIFCCGLSLSSGFWILRAKSIGSANVGTLATTIALAWLYSALSFYNSVLFMQIISIFLGIAFILVSLLLNKLITSRRLLEI